MIYLDFAKAFDKVVLMHTLKGIGVLGNLSVWIGNFLEDRTQCVRIKGSTSNPASVTGGFPQGTVLDPVLFLILMSDISQNIICFADDTRLFMIILTHLPYNPI